MSLRTPRAEGLNAWINNEDEYRANFVKNGKVLFSTTQGYNNRTALEKNLEKVGIDPDDLPSRISRL